MSSQAELPPMEQTASDSDAPPPSPPVVHSLYPSVATVRPPPVVSNDSRRACAPIFILPIASIALFALAAVFFYFFARQLANSPIVNAPIGLVIFLALVSLVCGFACCASFVYYTMKKKTRCCGGVTRTNVNPAIVRAPVLQQQQQQQQQQYRRRQYGDAAATSMRHHYRHPIYHHAAHIHQPAGAAAAATHPNAVPPATADVTAQPID